MKDYDHMTILDENVNRMELTYLYNVFLSLNLRASYWDLNTREKWYVSFMYNMYANASNNTLLTLMLVHTWYEESHPLGYGDVTCNIEGSIFHLFMCWNVISTCDASGPWRRRAWHMVSFKRKGGIILLCRNREPSMIVQMKAWTFEGRVFILGPLYSHIKLKNISQIHIHIVW